MWAYYSIVKLQSRTAFYSHLHASPRACQPTFPSKTTNKKFSWIIHISTTMVSLSFFRHCNLPSIAINISLTCFDAISLALCANPTSVRHIHHPLSTKKKYFRQWRMFRWCAQKKTVDSHFIIIILGGGCLSEISLCDGAVGMHCDLKTILAWKHREPRLDTASSLDMQKFKKKSFRSIIALIQFHQNYFTKCIARKYRYVSRRDSWSLLLSLALINRTGRIQH